MKLNTHAILFAQKTFDNNTIIFPFQLEVQTTSLSIEKYCLKNYKDLLGFEAFSFEQLVRLQKMKSYITKTLSPNDISDMVNVLKSKGWFNNLPINSKTIFKFKIDDVRCKMLSDIYPYLTIYGKISINLKELLDVYINKKQIIPEKSDNKFIKEVVNLKILQPFPFILTYERSFDIQQKIINIITEYCNRSTVLSNGISNAIGINEIHKFKKEIQWYGDNVIRVTINDFGSLLKAKAKKSWLPLSFAGVMAYSNTQKKKAKTQILSDQINVFEKMLKLTKETDQYKKNR